MRSRDEWLPVAEVGRRIGASPSTVRSLIRAGRLSASRHVPNGKWVVRESECDRYEAELEASKVQVAA